jgi:DNA integrity scanning protein DisA with diadenylate cyclase activity
MSCALAYPPDLARYVQAHWPEATPLALPPELLDDALAAAFQASLTSEEARPTRFRLLLTPASALPLRGEPNEGVLRLMFDRARPLVPDELRRLAPAVPFETALIGAEVHDGALGIWGIAHSGPAWLAPTWGGRSLVPNWTYDPIIHVSGPGQLAVRCAGKLVGAIERGALVDAVMDVFDSEWLPALFAPEREEVRKEHASLQASSASPRYVESGLIGRVAQHMLRRAIQLVRGAQHGGLILVTDGGLDGLRLKFSIEQDEASHRYRTILLRLLDAVSRASTKPSIGWSDFVANDSIELAKLEKDVFEWSRAIANLAAIDGAVVVDKRLGVVGFGAEVSNELPAPARVWRALDTEGVELRPEELEAVGTRHRAAYRFVNDHPAALAIVISHDGGVSFVANRDGNVVFWEQSIRP